MSHAIAVFDWIWSPFFGPVSSLLAVAAMVLLVVCGVAANWVLDVPGGVGPAERRDQDSPRVRRSWIATFGLIVVGPAAIGLGMLNLFFPLERPTAVLLISRSRSTTLPSKVWHQELGKLRDVVERSERPVIDAGPAVDRACERVMALQGETPLDSDSAGSQKLLRRALLELWSAPDADELIDRRSARTACDAALSGARVEARLPRWVVDTLEFGVLRMIAQRRNVSHVVVVSNPRTTWIGSTWDEGSEGALERDSNRWAPTEVDVLRAAAEDEDQLVDLLGVNDAVGGGVDVECLLQLARKPVNGAVGVRVALAIQRGRGAPLARSVPIELQRADRRRLVRLVVHFASVPTAGDAVLVIEGTTTGLPWRTAKGTGNAAGWRPRIAFDVSAADTWRRTLEWLSKDEADGPRQALRERLKRRGFLPAPADVTWGVGDDTVVVRALPSSGVWITPRRALELPALVMLQSPGPKSSDLQQAHPPVYPPPSSPNIYVPPILPAVGRVLDGGLPGTYSWQDVPLEPDLVGHPFVGTATRVLVERRFLFASLEASRGPAPFTTARPLVTQSLLPALRPQDQPGIAFHVALDPAAQAVLLDGQGARPERFDLTRTLTFWNTVLELAAALEMGKAREEDSPHERETSAPPRFVLTSGDLAEVRTTSLIGAMSAVMVGIIAFVFIVLRGIHNTP